MTTSLRDALRCTFILNLAGPCDSGVDSAYKPRVRRGLPPMSPPSLRLRKIKQQKFPSLMDTLLCSMIKSATNYWALVCAHHSSKCFLSIHSFHLLILIYSKKWGKGRLIILTIVIDVVSGRARILSPCPWLLDDSLPQKACGHCNPTVYFHPRKHFERPCKCRP